MNNAFLPMTLAEVRARGWDELDVILVTGDAYVDHPSFGASVVGRYLEHHGFKVAVIAQPDWRSPDDFTRLGRPRLFFGITAGNTDSMIANYTANKKPRNDDKYSPGDKAGMRPDRALIVYANRIRESFGDVPIVLGGLEASLRRLAHYDYWDDRVRHSILIDSRAEVLVYGMGERQALEIARRASAGEAVRAMNGIRGTAVVRHALDSLKDLVELPSFEEVASNTEKYSSAFCTAVRHMEPSSAKTLAQRDGNRYVVQFPPAKPFSTQELDLIYSLPYTRRWHPRYDIGGGVRALETVKFSITSHRGCCGECSFCSLYFHQGRIVQSRSQESVVSEARLLASCKDFGGTITDIGGPTANLYGARCSRWDRESFCLNKKCLVPGTCEQLRLGYDQCISLYEKVRSLAGVRHIFIGSGVRYDLLIDQRAEAYLKQLCRYHVSGLLKVAPEHCSDEVLRYMNKPRFGLYEQFVKKFRETARALGKDIYIVNYFIVSHPGATLRETLKLALYLAKRNIRPEQIQDFIPSPMTLATCMYYTGYDPSTGKKVYVPRTFRERKQQRALVQYDRPANRPLVLEALKELDAMHVAPKLLGCHPRESKTRGPGAQRRTRHSWGTRKRGRGT